MTDDICRCRNEYETCAVCIAALHRYERPSSVQARHIDGAVASPVESEPVFAIAALKPAMRVPPLREHAPSADVQAGEPLSLTRPRTLASAKALPEQHATREIEAALDYYAAEPERRARELCERRTLLLETAIRDLAEAREQLTRTSANLRFSEGIIRERDVQLHGAREQLRALSEQYATATAAYSESIADGSLERDRLVDERDEAREQLKQLQEYSDNRLIGAAKDLRSAHMRLEAQREHLVSLAKLTKDSPDLDVKRIAQAALVGVREPHVHAPIPPGRPGISIEEFDGIAPSREWDGWD